MRPLFELFVSLLLCLLVARTWLLQTFVVDSGSMAQALCGIHRRVICPDCEFPFAVGASESDLLPSLGAQAVCPNCFANCPLDPLPNLAGDRLLALRGAFQCRQPRRWELALFRDPDDATQIAVKRVAGLPGELIQIITGNLYRDRQLVRKSLADQQSVAQLVNDDRYRPKRNQSASRWRAASASTRWRQLARGFQFDASSADSTAPHARTTEPVDRIDWLAYRHPPRGSSATGPATDSAIDDIYGYNQGVPIVEVHPVDELLLSCQWRVSGGGQIAVLARSAGHEFKVLFDTRRPTVQLFAGDKLVAEAPCDLADGRRHLLHVSTIDLQLMCAFDGALLFAPFPYARLEPANAVRTSAKPPFLIGATSLKVELEHLRMFRDVYYTRPRAAPARACDQPYRLGPEEYFLLGDNSPVSGDSRRLSAPEITESLLIGKPIPLRRKVSS